MLLVPVEGDVVAQSLLVQRRVAQRLRRDPRQDLGEQAGGVATSDAPSGSGQGDVDAGLEVGLADDDAGAFQHLLPGAADADAPRAGCGGTQASGGLGESASEEVGGRGASARGVDEVLGDLGGVAVHDHAHQRRRGVGVDLHVVHQQPGGAEAVCVEVVPAAQLLVPGVSPSVQGDESLLQGAAVRHTRLLS